MKVADLTWILLPLGALFLCTLLGVYRIRALIGRRWASILMISVGALGSVAICAGLGYLAYLSASFADSLRNPKPIPQVAADWAPNFSPSERTKFSRMFAESSFRERGVTLKYISSDGQLVAFVPGPEDEARRAQHLSLISAMDKQARTALVFAVVALLVQIAALFFARTALAPWIYGLEARLEQWRRAA